MRALLALLMLLLPSPPARAQYVPSAQPVAVILDDDVGSDIDNYVDWRLFNTLAANRQIVALGGIVTTNEANGLPGVAAARAWSNVGYPLYKLAGATGGVAWVGTVAAQFDYSDQNGNYPSNCELGYRQLLAAAKRPVAIVMGGGPGCLDQLLDSPANDGGDGLGTGAALIQAHVAYVIWAAGTWPSGTGDPNMTQNSAASADLLANWASLTSNVPFYFYGVNLSSAATGPFPSGVCQNSTSDPYQLAFYAYSPNANPCTRTFWTQPALLFTEQGPAPVLAGTSSLFSVGAQGTASFNSSTGANSFTVGAGPFYYLANVASQASLQSQACAAERVSGTNWC